MDYYKIIFFLIGLFSTLSMSLNKSRRDGRMVGANVTVHANYSYQVAIYKKTNPGTSIICGGSILDDYHIISAAHCFINHHKPPFSWRSKPLFVVAGASDILNDNSSNWVLSKVSRVYVPTIYRNSLLNGTNTVIGDIAVLKLNTPFKLNEPETSHLHSVRLPSEADYTNVTAVVSGYGANDIWYEISGDYNEGEWKYVHDDKLRAANARVLSNRECQDFLNLHMGERETITDKHVCAQVHQTNTPKPSGVCDADSGGPLVYAGNVLVGVVGSSPINCDERGSPGIYARVSSFKSFIKKVQDFENFRNDTEIMSIDLPI